MLRALEYATTMLDDNPYTLRGSGGASYSLWWVSVFVGISNVSIKWGSSHAVCIQYIVYQCWMCTNASWWRCARKVRSFQHKLTSSETAPRALTLFSLVFGNELSGWKGGGRFVERAAHIFVDAAMGEHYCELRIELAAADVILPVGDIILDIWDDGTHIQIITTITQNTQSAYISNQFIYSFKK